jgi:hypothetical protein
VSVEREAALTWAAAGVPVFPCAISEAADRQATRKRPLTAHGHLDASTDPEVVASLFADASRRSGEEVGVGIWPGPAGLVLLDFDVKRLAPGMETFKSLVAAYGDTWALDRWRSASGGMNVLCRVPEGMTLGNAAPVEWRGVDVRSANGWAVAPPTVTPWGSWTWEHERELGERLAGLGTMPVEMAKMIPSPNGRGEPGPVADDETVRRYIAARTVWSDGGRALVEQILDDFHATASAGNRHPAMVRAVGRLVGLNGIDLDEALLGLQNEWDFATKGEGREREVAEVVAWAIGRELAARNGGGFHIRDAAPGEAAAGLASCLARLVEAFERWVVWPSDRFAPVLALWVTHTHLMAAFETTPRLAVLSPVKGSGKTRVLELLEACCAGPMFAVNVSTSALFRRLDAGRATLLLDEADTHLGGNGKVSEKYEELRAIVNAGYRRGAKVFRSEATGRKVEEREFDVFAPVALAGIGDLPDTVLDRSIIVPMRRRSPRERVDRYRVRTGNAVLHPLRDELARLAPLLVDLLADARPELPDGIEDRAADCWEPLIVIADAAGGSWPAQARAAAVEVNELRTERAPSLGEALLNDCRRVLLVDRDLPEVTSSAFVEFLCDLDEAPWSELHGTRLDARGLARRLRPFDVRPGVLWVGDKTLRGYTRAAFVDAWERYLPPLSPLQEPKEPKEPKGPKG